MGISTQNPPDLALLVGDLLRRVQRGDQIPPRLLDIEDAGRYLGASGKIIRQLIQRGELPFVQRIPGRSPYLLDIKDLDHWIDANKQRAF
jgi:excisionase family DNA binding protein